MEIFSECVPETGKISEHVLETGKISEHVLENRKNSGTGFGNPETFRNVPKTGKISEHVPETGKSCASGSGNQIFSVTRPKNRKNFWNMFRKLIFVTRLRYRKNFRNKFRKLEKNLQTILDTVRDWLWILQLHKGGTDSSTKFPDSRTILWILKCVSFVTRLTEQDIYITN